MLSVVHRILPNPIITDTGKTAWFLSRCAITDGVAVMLFLFWFWFIRLNMKTTISEKENKKKTSITFLLGGGGVVGCRLKEKSNKMMKN